MNGIGVVSTAAAVAAAVLTFPALAQSPPPPGGKPNIVFILMDNLGAIAPGTPDPYTPPH